MKRLLPLPQDAHTVSTSPIHHNAAGRVLTSRRATRESWELSPNKDGGAGIKEALEMGPVEVQGTLSVGMEPLLPSDGSDFFNGDSRNRLKDSSCPCKSGMLPPSADSDFLMGELRNPPRDKSGAWKSNNYSTRIRTTLARPCHVHECKAKHKQWKESSKEHAGPTQPFIRVAFLFPLRSLHFKIVIPFINFGLSFFSSSECQMLPFWSFPPDPGLFFSECPRSSLWVFNFLNNNNNKKYAKQIKVCKQNM